MHTPILDPINPQLKNQPRTLNLHMQLEIQIIKLHPLGSRQPREQTLRHGIDIRRQRADFDELGAEGLGRRVGLAGDELVFDDEGLGGPEIARVVEGDGLVG